MKRMAAAVLVLILAAVTAVAASPTWANDARDERPSWAGTLLSAKRVGVTEQYPKGTTAHRVKYLSTDPGGAPVLVSGLVLVPPGGGDKPVLSWGHGTTGIGDDCAPSLVEGAGAFYDKTLARFLRAGYAVAATDYAGLGTPGTHPYLVPESAARSMIDSVVAARALEPKLSARWAAAGHSQGGQAAMAVAEQADDYDAGLRFAGAVVFAPAPNMSRNVDELERMQPLEQTFYAMMLVGLKTQHPELAYPEYLDRRARALLPAVRSECFDDLAERFTQTNLPGMAFKPRTAEARERLRGWFAENEIGRTHADGPLFVAQGAADPVVLEPETTRLVRESKAQGSRIAYRVYPKAGHGGVLDASHRDALAWLVKRLPVG